MTDAEYAEKLRVQLIARLWPTSRISDALAEAAAHCADSGERAEDAFGSPVEYAARLDDAWRERDPRRRRRLAMLVGEILVQWLLVSTVIFVGFGLLSGDDPVTLYAAYFLGGFPAVLVLRFAVLIREKWLRTAAIAVAAAIMGLSVAAARHGDQVTVELTRVRAAALFAAGVGGLLLMQRYTRGTGRGQKAVSTTKRG